MSILWFVIGLGLGIAYIWLQWLQVKKINPDNRTVRPGFMVSYVVRLVLFVIVESLALWTGLLNGLMVFTGFWMMRSLLLIFIGSGRVHWSARRNL
jgi:hypothetical protein